MNVVVNGRDTEVGEGSTLADLVVSLGFGTRQVVIEHNGEPVERGRFSEVVVVGDDVVEIVRAVPGG